MSLDKSAPASEVSLWHAHAPGIDRSRTTEVCHVISGSGTVTGEDGISAEIGPGSLLVLPRGWRGTWVVRETIRKSNVTVDD